MGSITPVAYRVTCAAWECRPDADRISPAVTAPLLVDATSAAEAARLARAHGWRPAPGRGAWWCPRHAAVAASRRSV